ncbi:hypothetical protein BGZ81_007112 [Podila clonocystis]|nr:hypothetical protein BGZ81_007112 [Podila clonocystis]
MAPPCDCSKSSIFDIPLIAQSICRYLTSGDICASLQVSHDWYTTFEPQLWHDVHLRSIWQPSWPVKRAILRNAERIRHLDIEDSFFLFLVSSQDRQNGYTSPCAYLKSLRIKDKNIDDHPRHEYHTILGRCLEGLYTSDSNILTGSVEALNLGENDPVSYEPNQIQAVLDIIDASPGLRSLELQLECNSTLFCMALCRSLSRLRSLESFKWTFACFFDPRLLWAFLWLLPNVQHLELLGHCEQRHIGDRDDGSDEFFEYVAQLVQADRLHPREKDPSTTSTARAEHPIKSLSIEGKLWYNNELPELTQYLARSPHLTTLKLPTVSRQVAEALVPILSAHCPYLRWIELCASNDYLPLDTTLHLIQGYHKLVGFAVGLEPTSVQPVIQVLQEHSAQTLEHFAIYRGSTTYPADALALLTGFPRLAHLDMFPHRCVSARLSELVAAEWTCGAVLRVLRMGVYVDSHGVAQRVSPSTRGGRPAKAAQVKPDNELRDRVAQQTLGLFRKLRQMPQLAQGLKLEWASTVEMERTAGLAAMGEGQMTFLDLCWMGVQWKWQEEAMLDWFDDDDDDDDEEDPELARVTAALFD